MQTEYHVNWEKPNDGSDEYTTTCCLTMGPHSHLFENNGTVGKYLNTETK